MSPSRPRYRYGRALAAAFRIAVLIDLLCVTSALARPDYTYLSGFAFVAAQGASRVMVLDADLHGIVDTVDVGLAPAGLEISAASRKIAAIDARTPRLAIYGLVSGSLSSVSLDFVPHRLLVAPDGRYAAVADLDAGDIAVVDLATLETVARLRLGPINDALFDAGSAILHIARRDRAGLQSFDVRTGAQKASIVGRPAAAYDLLARAPDGRSAFARVAGAARIDVIDLVHARTMSLPLDGGQVYASGTGRYVLAPDRAARKLAVATLDPPAVVARVETGIAANVLYTAWFDSVVFAAGAETGDVLVYDLDARRALGSLHLAAAPGRGVVTSDGAAVFLPLPATGKVAVLDARTRKIADMIDVPGRPFIIVMAGGYGLCH